MSTNGSRPTDVVGGDSPVDAPVPFWITACVRLRPPRRRSGSEITASLANAVFPAVQALIADRNRMEGEAPLNRDQLARHCGLGDAKKAGWLFDYLESIGFLRIRRNYAGPGRGRRMDTFKVFLQPSPNYVGPRTHDELKCALNNLDQTKTPPDLFGGKPAGQAQGSQFGTFSTDQGAESGTLVGKPAGQAQGSQSGTFSTDQGAESGTLVGKPAGQAQGSQSGTFSLIDRSSISEREIEGSTEPVPGGAAMPPATGLDEGVVAAVREQVRRLPWRQWAKVKLGVENYQLMRPDADKIQDAMCSAMARDGISLEQVTEVARHALAEAKGPVYVIRAFEPRTLGEWLRRLRLEVEPLAEDTLPLPGQPKRDSAAKPVKQGKSADGQANRAALPACEVCGADENTPAGERQVYVGPGVAIRHCDCTAPLRQAMPAPSAARPGRGGQTPAVNPAGPVDAADNPLALAGLTN